MRIRSVRSSVLGVLGLALVTASGCASGKPAMAADTAAATATSPAPPSDKAAPPAAEPPAAASGFADRCASGDRAGCLTDGDYATQQGQLEQAIRLYERGCELGAARGCADAAKLSDKVGESERAEKLRERARLLTNLDR